MRWPFRPERSTDMRVLRDPKTNETVLKVRGDHKVFIATFELTVNFELTQEMALQLRDQINNVFGPAESDPA